jgi:hypothetical protein
MSVQAFIMLPFLATIIKNNPAAAAAPLDMDR